MAYRPLADEIRPQSLDQVVGQRHILGENGLLHGRKYTCYPGFENDEKYHGTYTAAPLQQDGKIITANGAGNAMTFALYLLAALQGEEKALEVGRSIQMKL